MAGKLPAACPAYNHSITAIGVVCWAESMYTSGGSYRCSTAVDVNDTLGLCEYHRKLIVGV